MAKSKKQEGSSTKAAPVARASKKKETAKDQRRYFPPFMGSISSALKASQESEHSQ
jgi:hypothetical protein